MPTFMPAWARPQNRRNYQALPTNATAYIDIRRNAIIFSHLYWPVFATRCIKIRRRRVFHLKKVINNFNTSIICIASLICRYISDSSALVLETMARNIENYKKLDHWRMQIKRCHSLTNHNIWAIIIHQIFSLARDWSKHVKWPNIPRWLSTISYPTRTSGMVIIVD